jgi:hypothetical protein
MTRDALDGMPHEKFARIVGLFNAVVPSDLKTKKDGVYLNPLVREFEELRALIDGKLAAKDFLFQRDDLGHAVHNLNLLLGELLPAFTLESALPGIRDDYRARVGADVYGAYMTSPGYKALEGCDRLPSPETRLRLLRADYLQLTNEIRKMTLLEYHVEETRSFLIRKLRRTLCKLLIAPIAIITLFAFCSVAIIDVQKSAVASAPAPMTTVDANGQSLIKLYPSPESALNSAPQTAKAEPAWALSRLIAHYLMGSKPGEWTRLFKALVLLTLLSFAAIAGAIGSFISALLRIEAVPETTEIARSVVTLRYSESIRLAPVTGMIFAVLLSFVFGGQLLKGNLFPNAADNPIWPFLLFVPAELAKWLVWCFIVGFSERLMPDMIDRLIARSGKGDQTPAPASIGRGTGGRPGSNGSNGNGTNIDSPSPPAAAQHQPPRSRTRRPVRTVRAAAAKGV